MKLTFFTILINAINLLACNAQTSLSLQAGGGINGVSVFLEYKDGRDRYDITDFLGLSPLYNYEAGINSNIKILRFCEISIGMFYFEKSYKFKNEFETETIINRHINVPIGFNIYTRKRLFFYAGIDNNFRINNVNNNNSMYNISGELGTGLTFGSKLSSKISLYSDISPFFYYQNIDSKQAYYTSGIICSVSYKIFEK